MIKDLKPGQQGSPYSIVFSGAGKKYGINLVGTPTISAMTEDTMAVYIERVGKRIGDFAEQRDWKGGRGGEFFSDDPTRYADVLYGWTLSSGHVVPSPQWRWASGYRTAFTSMPGNMNWASLSAGGTITTAYTPGAISAVKCWVWIKRIGNPAALTFNLLDNSNNVLKTATVTTNEVTDVVSVCYPFEWTGVQVLSAATVYKVQLVGAAGDNAGSHWEAGTDGSGNLYARITDADTARRWFFWKDGTNFWAVDKKDSGNSQVYSISTAGVCTEITGHGLGTVVNKPVIAGAYHYFPQGESTNIRRWDGASTWADDGTNKASFLTTGNNTTDGLVVWRGNNTANAPTVSYAKAAAPLVFNTALPLGSNLPITGMHFWINNGLYVFTWDAPFVVSNNTVTYKAWGLKNTPSAYNGLAIAEHQQFLYFSWLYSLNRLYGDQVDDVGMGWAGPALPDGREGNISKIEAYVGFLFYSIDAGAGISSLWCWDGMGNHEIFRAPYAGMRIQNFSLQIGSGAGWRNKLWIDCGGDLIFIRLPFMKARPIDDSTFMYQHEFALTSSIIDMGTASKLRKIIRSLTATTKNLDGQGIKIKVDYQVDDKCGTDTWVTDAGTFLESPEDTVNLNIGNITQFRYRLRAQTNNALIPPDLKGVVPTGYARSPYRRVYTMRTKAGEIFTPMGTKAISSKELKDWLEEVATFPNMIHMTSIFESLNDKYVMIAPSTIYPTSPPSIGTQEQDIFDLTLIEI